MTSPNKKKRRLVSFSIITLGLVCLLSALGSGGWLTTRARNARLARSLSSHPGVTKTKSIRAAAEAIPGSI